jgi:hypothetical protein
MFSVGFARPPITARLGITAYNISPVEKALEL